jgi:hypothetical protein
MTESNRDVATSGAYAFLGVPVLLYFASRNRTMKDQQKVLGVAALTMVIVNGRIFAEKK